MTDDDSADSDETLTYQGGFNALVSRMDARRVPLSFAQGESLPPVNVDLAPLKKALVRPLDMSTVPRAKNQSGHLRKSIELNPEFEGLPELCKLHGLLIAHLRKRAQPEHTMALFSRIWAEEAEFLFEHLDPRWLVSAITTFGDQGQNEVQRRVGQSMTVLFSTMKLYESERLYSGLKPAQEFKLKRLVHSKLPLNMDRYALMSGGLDVNMLARLWIDAAEDRVIAPLAHHLLDMLNRDPGTVFRRLATLRGRKARQKAQAAPSGAAEEPEPAAQPSKPFARARTNDWAVVSTIKAPLSHIMAFRDHHLAMGAQHLYIYLDDENATDFAAALSGPKVTATLCDAAYWTGIGKPRFEKHQQRQALNATRCYRAAQADWLAHIDCDEYLHAPHPITSILAGVPDTVDALMMPPAEELAQPAPAPHSLFRRTYFDAARPKSVLDDLYPTFARYLRSGFVSHTAGKTMARTGLAEVRFGVHMLKRDGREISAVERSPDLTVLHRHAPDWDSFAAHLAFRLSKGSYRSRDKNQIGLGDIIDVLIQEHGHDGPRRLFDEVCSARPEVVRKLEAEGMLIRAQLPDMHAAPDRIEARNAG